MSTIGPVQQIVAAIRAEMADQVRVGAAERRATKRAPKTAPPTPAGMGLP